MRSEVVVLGKTRTGRGGDEARGGVIARPQRRASEGLCRWPAD